MRTHRNSKTQRSARERGSILILSTVVLFIVAGFVLSLLTLSTASQRTAQINSKKLTAQGLADGAIELGKQWTQTQWANQDGGTVNTKAVTSLDQLSDDAKWSAVQISGLDARYGIVRIAPTLDPTPNAASKANYTPDGLGWWVDGNDGVRSNHYLYAIYGHAEYTPKLTEGDSRTVVANASRVIELVVTPLFQYAVFYNQDLEILPGPDMTLTGRVHSNRDMFLGCGATLTMSTDYVRAVGNIYRKRKDDNTPATGVVLVKNLANCSDASTANDFQYKLPNGATASAKMLSKAEMSALGIGTPTGFDSSFGGFDSNGNGSVNDSQDWKPWATQAMSFWGGAVQTAAMDVPKSEPPQQNLSLDEYAPKAGGDYVQSSPGVFTAVTPGTGDYAKGFFNSKAGLILKDGQAYAPDGTNVSSALLAGTLSTLNIWDARENKFVPQTKVDVGLLKQSLAQAGASAALASLKNSWNGLVYGTASGASSSTPKGILLTNGSELPNNPLTNAKTGMTVASNLPVYVQGDYNTKVNGLSSATNDPAFHKPAAVIADAVNLLSNAWNNSKTAASSLPTASATTFNTAMLSGNVPSVAGSSYSGGLENLPRFHENWTGKNCTIAGSFVNLWPSKIAKGAWVYGGKVYTAPNRIWDFDPNYKDFTKLPPFTPLVVTVNDVCAQQ